MSLIDTGHAEVRAARTRLEQAASPAEITAARNALSAAKRKLTLRAQSEMDDGIRHDYAQEAALHAIDPESLHAQVRDIITLYESTAREHRRLIEDIHRQRPDLRTLQLNEGSRGALDYQTGRAGFDELATAAASEYPNLFAGHEGREVERLHELLIEGKPEKLPLEAAYREALDGLINYAKEHGHGYPEEAGPDIARTIQAVDEASLRPDQQGSPAAGSESIGDAHEQPPPGFVPGSNPDISGVPFFRPQRVAFGETGRNFFRSPGEPFTGAPEPRRPSSEPGGSGGRPGGLIDDIKKFAAPATRGAEAAEGGAGFRHVLGEMERSKQVAIEHLRRQEARFDREIVRAENPEQRAERFLSLMDPLESGHLNDLPEDLRDYGRSIRDLFNQRTEAATIRGIVKSTIEHWIGHLWQKPGSTMSAEEIGRMLGGRRPLAGREGFRRQRILETYRAGIELGLEPVDWNPARLLLRTLEQVDRSVMAHDLVNRELKPVGMWNYVPLGGKVKEGHVRINDKLATVFAPGETRIHEYFDKQQMEGLEHFAGSLGIDLNRPASGVLPSGALGMQEPNRVTTRFGTPEEILAHEIGHELDRRYNLRQLAEGKETGPEMQALADLRASGRVDPEYRDYLRSPQETAANLIAAYVHAPELLHEVAPRSAAWLDSLLERTPELRPLRDIKPSLELGQREQAMRLAGPMLTGHYYTPEPVARLLNNYLEPGLRGNRVYDAIREFGNVLNGFQLGFSAFHAGFVMVDTMTSGVALALQQASRGRLADSLKSLVLSPTRPFSNFVEGSRLSREYFRPGSQGAETAAMLDQIVSAGARAANDTFYGNGSIERFRQALRGVRAAELGHTGQETTPGTVALGRIRQGASVLYHALPALNEFLSKPIMSVLVPRMKLGVMADMARLEMQRLGPEADPRQLRQALGRAWDSVENRLGQVTYDNLFWNRTMKDSLMAGVRSVGWNLGTWRELGGGVADIPSGMRGVLRGEGISPRTSYLIAMPMVTAAFGALYTYLATGQAPQDSRDYFFPRDGTQNHDGNPNRVSLPSYMRDVAALTNRADEGPERILRNMWHMASGKIHPAIGLLAEMMENRDWHGQPIDRPQEGIVQGALNLALHVLRGFEPMFTRPLHQEPAQQPTAAQAARSFIGITPAPATIRRPWEQQRAIEAARGH